MRCSAWSGAGRRRSPGANTLPAEQTQEAWTADRAIEMIDAFGDGSTPFLVAASFFGPHFPYAVPEPYDTRYDPAEVARPENFDERFPGKPLIQQKELMRWNAAHLTWPDWQRVIAAYWGYCSFVDYQMGRVLEALERSGHGDDTIVRGDLRSRRHARQSPAVQQRLPHVRGRPTACRC